MVRYMFIGMLYLVADINLMCITKVFPMFCDQKEAEEDLKLLSEVSTAAVQINKIGRTQVQGKVAEWHSSTHHQSRVATSKQSVGTHP